MNLKMNAKNDDIQILKLSSVVMTELLCLRDLIEKQLPFKKSKDWETFFESVDEMQNDMDDFVEEMKTKLAHSYGTDKVNQAEKLANNHLNSMIQEEQFYRRTYMYRGKPFEVTFLVEEDKDIKLCNIYPEPTEKGVKSLMEKLLLDTKKVFPKATLDSIQALYPLDYKELKHLEGEIVTDLSGEQHVIESVFREDKEPRIRVRRDVKLVTEELTKAFKLNGENIGKWDKLKFH